MTKKYKIWMHLEEITTDEEGNEEYADLDDIVESVAYVDTIEEAEQLMSIIHDVYFEPLN